MPRHRTYPILFTVENSEVKLLLCLFRLEGRNKKDIIPSLSVCQVPPIQKMHLK